MEPDGDSPAESSSNRRIKICDCLCFCFCFRGLVLTGSLSRLRSTARELPVFKKRCKNLIARLRKRHRNSVDFRYDPLSYALNFDDGENADAQMMSSFSARLPASPPPPPQRKGAVHPTVAIPEIVACG